MQLETINITTIVALWGAVTGSLALLIQFITFKKDRSKLQLKVKMYTRSSEPDFENRKIFEFQVANIGRRVCNIEFAALELRQFIPFFSDNTANTYICLLRPGESEVISLKEQGKHVFKIDPIAEEIVERLGWFARVYLIDTAGKKYYKRFMPMTA